VIVQGEGRTPENLLAPSALAIPFRGLVHPRNFDDLDAVALHELDVIRFDFLIQFQLHQLSIPSGKIV